MIIFDLICTHNHIFEGWFSSSQDYESQKESKLLRCPICGSEDIKKSIMAPNVGIKANQKKITSPKPRVHHPSSSQMSTAEYKEIEQTERQGQLEKSDIPLSMPNNNAIEEAVKTLAKVQEAVLKESVWVGNKFSQEARSMHYGETDKRQIHGSASQKEANELQEEGIEIAALPLPYIPPNLKN